MLTPRLEKLILEGKAQYGVFNAAFASSIINNDKGSTIIVIGAKVFGWFDYDSARLTFTNEQLARRCMHSMRIGSGKASNYVTFRNSWRFAEDAAGIYAVPDQVIDFDFYLPMKGNVAIEFTTIRNEGNWIFLNNVANPSIGNDNQGPEVGYGTQANGGLSTVRYLDFQDAGANSHLYVPRGQVENFTSGVLANRRVNTEFIGSPSTENALQNFTPYTNPKQGFNFPIANIFYVKIPEGISISSAD